MKYDTNPDLADATVSVAEMLEQCDDPHDIPTIGTDYTVRPDGVVKEVELKINGGTGTQFVQLLSGTVTGFDHGDRWRTHFDSDRMEEYGKRLADRMEQRID